MPASFQNETDDSANPNSPSGLRSLLVLLGFAQLLLGAFGLFGFYQYFVEPVENVYRYQLIFIPYMAFALAVPLLIISAPLYRRCRRSMTSTERWVVNVGCLLPLLALAAAMTQS